MSVSDYLRALKTGDQVYVLRGGYGRAVYDRKEVAKVTPTGRVELTDGDVFNPDGCKRGAKRLGGYGSAARIVEPSPKVTTAARRSAAVKAFETATQDWREWPTERIEVVTELVLGNVTAESRKAVAR